MRMYSEAQLRKAIRYTVGYTLCNLLVVVAMMYWHPPAAVYVERAILFFLPFLWAKRIYEWHYQRSTSST